MKWDEIKDTLRLDEVEDALGLNIVSRKNNEYRIKCPLPTHPGADNNPSMYLNSETFLWTCFTCNKGGALPLLVSQIFDLDWDSSIRWLAPYSDYLSDDDNVFLKRINNLLNRDEDLPVRRVPTLPELPESLLDTFSDDGSAFWRERKITDEVIIKLKLLYCDDHERRGHVGPCAIIPHYFRGKLVGWQERWIGERPKHIPKYSNTTDFPKAETLYNYDNAINDHTSPILVVESALTVARLASLGFVAVGTFGAMVTKEQIRLLKSINKPLLLSYDNDMPGRKANDHLMRVLEDFPVQSVKIEGEQKADLGDLTDEQVYEILGSS